MTDQPENRMPLTEGVNVAAIGGGWNSSGSPFAVDHERRDAYTFHTDIALRWSDFDMMGHVNNVQYMRFLECCVVEFFRTHDVFPPSSPVTAFAAENMCRFVRPLNYPLHTIACGMRVERLGTSSVRFGFGLFRPHEDVPAAVGYWAHVFIDRQTQRAAPMPDQSRAVFQKYLVTGAWTMPGA